MHLIFIYEISLCNGHLTRAHSGSFFLSQCFVLFFSVSVRAVCFQHQSCGVGQGEVWLVLTDPSLQEEQPEKGCRRTVAMCVSTSCVLTSSVLEALHSPAACHMSFRDAIKEHGNISNHIQRLMSNTPFHEVPWPGYNDWTGSLKMVLRLLQ